MSMNGLSFAKGSVNGMELSVKCMIDKMHSKFSQPMHLPKNGVEMLGFLDQYFVTFGFHTKPIINT